MTENMRSVIQYNMIQGKHGIILIVKVEQRYKTVEISGKNLVILKVERQYKTVKISGHAEKSHNYTSHCRFIGIIMADVDIASLHVAT